MSWRDLLASETEVFPFPWVKGRSIAKGARTWTIDGKLPAEIGWYNFVAKGREVTVAGQVEPDQRAFVELHRGYIVGDLLVPELDARGAAFCASCWAYTKGPKTGTCATCHAPIVSVEKVHLLEPMERFARVMAGRTTPGGPLVYVQPEMPLGPEDDAMRAYEDRAPLTAKGVTPGLHAAFAFAVRLREEEERRRAEAARRAREEAERLAAEARRRELIEKLGDGAGRRAMARVDFAEAARAALAVGGAEYLDSRRVNNGHEVKFRLLRRRFACIVDANLQVVDAGICLTAHYDDPDFEGGTRGDTWFTLESLPAVIREADNAGRLVVFRHV